MYVLRGGKEAEAKGKEKWQTMNLIQLDLIHEMKSGAILFLFVSSRLLLNLSRDESFLFFVFCFFAFVFSKSFFFLHGVRIFFFNGLLF